MFVVFFSHLFLKEVCKVAKKDSTVVIKREKISSIQNHLKLKLNKENMCAARNDQQQNQPTSDMEERHSSSGGDSLIENDFNELDLDAELQALDYDTNSSSMNDTKVADNRKM